MICSFVYAKPKTNYVELELFEVNSKMLFRDIFQLSRISAEIIMFKPKMSVSDIIRLSRISAENLAKPAELSKKYG